MPLHRRKRGTGKNPAPRFRLLHYMAKPTPLVGGYRQPLRWRCPRAPNLFQRTGRGLTGAATDF